MIQNVQQYLKVFLLFSFVFISKIACSQNIPSYFKKTPVFIFSLAENGETKPIGTGFFLIVIDSGEGFGYLVTNKHVITDPNTKSYFSTIKIRYNKLDKTFDNRIIRLSGSEGLSHVFIHSDSSVDLAVIPYVINDADVSYSTEQDLFKSKIAFDTSYIAEGTNIFYTGMFSPYLGYKKNYPITRFGKVALITDEKILFDSTEPKANLLLAETTTFGGNSGSPVFAYGSDYKITSNDSSDPVNFREQNHVHIYLIGIIKGYYGEDSPITFKRTSVMAPTYSTNIGITAIIPSYLVYEILNDEETRAFRAYIIKLNKKK